MYLNSGIQLIKPMTCAYMGIYIYHLHTYPMGIFLGLIRDLYKTHVFNPEFSGLNVGFIRYNIFEEQEVHEK
jgi:hypothetical protein